MKRLLFVLVVFSSSSLALVSGASAQNAGTDAKPKMEMKGGVHNMSGCLTKEGDSYIMMNADPKGPKRVAIVNNSVDLSPDVGDEIQITGVEVLVKDAEAMKGVPKADHYMKISAAKKLAGACATL
jgi:hypothetical protein